MIERVPADAASDAADEPTYYVQAFARLAQVTVRTLRYYDHVGLLSPARRGEMRIYRQRDLWRVQQILTLKALGFALRDIRALLDASGDDVRRALALQREAVRRQQAQLQRVAEALEQVEAHLAAAGALDWSLVIAVIAALQPESQAWVRRYFSDEALDRLAAQWTPEQIAAGTVRWRDLYAALDAVKHLPAESAEVQALVPEYLALIALFTGGDPALHESLRAMYSAGNADALPAAMTHRGQRETTQLLHEAAVIYEQKQRAERGNPE